MAEIDLGRVVGPPGTTDYNGTENRPCISGRVLEGDKTPAELGLVGAQEGMGLSHNDYTDEEKEKLAGMDAGANRYTHPATHPASMIVQDSTHRFVTDAKQREWDAVYAQAMAYVNLQIAALTDGAPEDMNTLEEIARAMRENADVLEVLRDAVAKKANEIELAAVAFSGSYADLSGRPSIPGAMAGASASAAGKGGTVPAPAKGAQGKYLRGDGTWQTPPDTKYTHPSTAGNKHIPAGGSSGQILRWSADGTAAWGADNNTTYGNMKGASASAAGAAGLVPAPAQGAQGKFLRGDGTWQSPPNTTYGAATQSAAGLMSADDKYKLDYTNAAFGTCETAAATAAKAVTLSGNTKWKLQPGSRVVVKFKESNKAASPTLNVNGTGAKPIWYNTAVHTAANTIGGYAGRCTEYVYDGTNYVWMGECVDNTTTYSNQSLGNGIGTCTTAEATAAKAAALSGYNLAANGTVAVKFTYAVPANATLNVNSRGAKPIYYRGAAITAGVIGAGDTAVFMYNGSQYVLLAVDREPGRITFSDTVPETLAEGQIVMVYE